MKRTWLVAVVLAAAALAVLGAAGGALWRLAHPNRVVVRNLGDRPVENLTLVLQAFSLEWGVTREVPRLEPGEAVTVRHACNDAKAALRFDIDGDTFIHKQHYMDLWRGETWSFDIASDGTVASHGEAASVQPDPGGPP